MSVCNFASPSQTLTGKTTPSLPKQIQTRITRNTLNWKDRYLNKYVRSHEPRNCIKICTHTNPKVQSSVPSIFLTNACHITNKMDELHSVVEINNPDLICISETWLDSNTPDCSVAIGTDYVPYRKDRGSLGGGLIVYVKTTIPSSRLCEMEEDSREVLWILMRPQRLPRPFSCIIMAAVYYPPGQPVINEKSLTDYLTNGIDTLLRSYPSAGIIIAGDFNKMNLGPLCNRLDLKKIIKKPTRQNNVLDQILTNMASLFSETQHLPPLGRSDHQCLFVAAKHRIPSRPITKTFRPIRHSSIISLELKLLKTVWNTIYNAEDVDEKIGAFNEIVTQALDQYLPIKSIRLHPTDKPWMTPTIKAEIKLRQRAFTHGNMIQYTVLRNKVENMIKKAKLKYYKKEAKTLRTTDPAKWFKAIYSLCGIHSEHSNVANSQMSEMTLAERLQESFVEPWNSLEPTSIPQLEDVEQLLTDYQPPLPSIGQIKHALKRINPIKSTGADGIPAWFLKRFADVLAPIVHDIITASIIQCKYPDHYKHGLVTPIPKVYPPVDITNDFRQISVLPHLAKLLERIQLQLNQHDIKVRPNQHGFTSGRSTTSALLSITQPWFDATDNTGNTQAGIHALFIDFKKAFDLVDHGILLKKLALMNVNKKLWLWVSSFLSGRTQQVKINQTFSTTKDCPAGVPQGSVLSPTLFNIHIDDLDSCVPHNFNIDTHKYADDCTQSKYIMKGNNGNMQDVLNSLHNWSNINKMKLSAKKTKDMWICFGTSIPEPPNLFIGGDMIERVEKFRLLGVTCQNNLKWNSHVEEITRKGNSRLYHLRQCRKAHLPEEVGLATYTTKIRPLLEYASPVWSGLPQYLINDIERIQRRSLRIIGLPDDALPTLNSRRGENTLRELESILKDNNHPCHNFISHKKTYNYNTRTSRIPKLKHVVSGTDRHRSSFVPRAVELFNENSK